MNENEKVGFNDFDIDENLTKGMMGSLTHKEIDALPKKYDCYKEQFHGWTDCFKPEFRNYSRLKTISHLMKLHKGLLRTKKSKRCRFFYLNPKNYWRAFKSDCEMRKEYKENHKILSKIPMELFMGGDNLRLLSQTIINRLIYTLEKFAIPKMLDFYTTDYSYAMKYERPTFTTVLRVSNKPCKPNEIDEMIETLGINNNEDVRLISVVISYEEEKSNILGEYIIQAKEIQENHLHEDLCECAKTLLLGELVQVCGRLPENNEIEQ